MDGIRKLAGEGRNVIYEKGCSYLGETVFPFQTDWLADEDGEAGLTARYYNNWDLSGEPVVTRRDSMVNFNWIYAKPHADVEAERFSVAWTGRLKARSGFRGCIAVPGQDSMRLYVDGKLLIDAWNQGGGRAGEASRMADFVFEEGREYGIRLEFCNDARGARVVFGYNKGREDWGPAIDMVRKADVAIVCLGDNVETSGENLDRTDLVLPGKQREFLKEIAATKTPVVLVLQNGRPLALTWEEAHIPAILECWFPGEKGGRAIAEVLFGKTYPSGRLPMSFPRTVGQVPCNYNRLPGGGWRYVEMDWNPLYPFGYGLTYTSFSYSDLKIQGDGIAAEAVEKGAAVKVSFTVTNTGSCFGEETAQLYLRDLV